MVKNLFIFVIVHLAVGIQAFHPNAFLSRMMTKVAGEENTSRSSSLRTTMFPQFIDFKNPELGTFNQTLVVNDQFYDIHGPIFILVSAREDNYGYWLENSIPTEIAQQKGGILFGVEPRYHGTSRPTADLSTSNLQAYNSIDHIINDYATIITYLKSTDGSKIILYGYDTGATLAAWIYSKYPNIVDGVWASSAPVYPRSEFSQYYSDIQNTFETINPTCNGRLKIALHDIEMLFASNQGSVISNLFGLGNILNVPDTNEVNLFYYSLLTGIGSLVEYSNVATVNNFCAIFDDTPEPQSLEALGEYFGEFFNGEKLTYPNLINHLRPDTWDSKNVLNGERQQLFQSCSYMSWFRTSTPSSSFHNVTLPFEFYSKLCKDVFWIEYDDIIAGNDWTERSFKIRTDLPNIYFTNGALDPYRLVGVISQQPQSSVDIMLAVGKSFDFRQANDEFDTKEMIDVKLRVKHLLESWIG